MATADERYRAPGEGLVSVWGCREAAESSGLEERIEPPRPCGH